MRTLLELENEIKKFVYEDQKILIKPIETNNSWERYQTYQLAKKYQIFAYKYYIYKTDEQPRCQTHKCLLKSDCEKGAWCCGICPYHNDYMDDAKICHIISDINIRTKQLVLIRYKPNDHTEANILIRTQMGLLKDHPHYEYIYYDLLLSKQNYLNGDDISDEDIKLHQKIKPNKNKNKYQRFNQWYDNVIRHFNRII